MECSYYTKMKEQIHMNVYINYMNFERECQFYCNFRSV